MTKRPTLLVDGNNVLVRAVEATRRAAMTSPRGVDTSALVVFVKSLARHIREIRPYRVQVLWDAPGPTWRHVLYPAYKATRKKNHSSPDHYRQTSADLARAFLALAHIPQETAAGQEADDLIACHWRTANTPVIILSSDKDLLQLTGRTPHGHDCTQIRLSSWDTPTDTWDEDKVHAHYGCTPAQWPLILALAGDASDDIPGVPGIGLKRAVKHLTDADWSIDAVTHPGIASHRDNGTLALYLELVDLRTRLYSVRPRPGPFMPTTPGPDDDWRALYEFLTGHQLRDLTRRLMDSELW